MKGGHADDDGAGGLREAEGSAAKALADEALQAALRLQHEAGLPCICNTSACNFLV